MLFSDKIGVSYLRKGTKDWRHSTGTGFYQDSLMTVSENNGDIIHGPIGSMK